MSDLDARNFVRQGHALVPCDLAALEYLEAIAEGKEVMIKVTHTRSPQHHRWFFTLLHFVLANTDSWSTEVDLLDDLKDAVGHAEPDRMNKLTRQRRRRTRSISFASMPEDKFVRFRDRCLDVLQRELGWDPVEVMEEIDASQRPAA